MKIKLINYCQFQGSATNLLNIGLQDSVNDWISENKSIEIIDIKYHTNFTVSIVYKEKL